ncbi:MAG: division/cell wall cluster transcriptional repressor MraZ [Bacilli bacterium]|nr:division/cell wall cluster transcriptional repressor MraZ [Bacilli bacterium]MBQ6282391.1 division/cell wall cluster transcriptional repressor MraZ [Bacilli bacterium]
MFIGEYHHNIDEKGRLIMPSKFRNDLGETFVITRGIDSCLFVYPKDSWNNITSKLNELSFTKKDVRSFQRFFLSAATICEFDKQGRINVTSPLADYADLTKECVIIGVNDRIEIWSKENFDKFLDDNIDNVSDIAEHLFEV